MSVLAGVERDLTELPPAFSGSGLAALARAMAERIDEGRGSPSECGKVLIDALAKLRELAPVKQEVTGLSVLRDDYKLKLVGGSGT